jgi:capsular polysaccharide biosynthesis protein
MEPNLEKNNILISYDSGISIRSLPINYDTKHNELFAHEFQKKIPGCYAKIESKVYIVDNCICHFFGFGRLSKYSKSSASGRKAKTLRIIKFLKLFQPAQLIPKGTWVIDDWSSGYFHWFADALTRAELVSEYTHNYPLILPAEFEDIGYIRKSLEILGIQYVYLNTKKPSKVEELLITSYTAPTGNYNKKLLSNLSKRFRGWVKEEQENTNRSWEDRKRKIYVSRANTYRRKISNELELLPIFKKYGFEVIYPENISFEDQLRIFYSTSVLVGLHGAGLTNMMFMQSGGTVIEIRRHGDAHNNCFFSMASDLNLRYCYLFAQSENDDMSFGNCHVEAEHLELLLSQY